MTGAKKDPNKEYNGWGGKREGSGAKSDGIKRKNYSFWASEEEAAAIREFLATLRNKPLKKQEQDGE